MKIRCQYCYRPFFRGASIVCHENFCLNNPDRVIRNPRERKTTRLCCECGRPVLNAVAERCYLCCARDDEFLILDALIQMGYGNVPQNKIPLAAIQLAEARVKKGQAA